MSGEGVAQMSDEATKRRSDEGSEVGPSPFSSSFISFRSDIPPAEAGSATEFFPSSLRRFVAPSLILTRLLQRI